MKKDRDVEAAAGGKIRYDETSDKVHPSLSRTRLVQALYHEEAKTINLEDPKSSASGFPSWIRVLTQPAWVNKVPTKGQGGNP